LAAALAFKAAGAAIAIAVAAAEFLINDRRETLDESMSNPTSKRGVEYVGPYVGRA
jgi:hypothetical protein